METFYSFPAKFHPRSGALEVWNKTIMEHKLACINKKISSEFSFEDVFSRRNIILQSIQKFSWVKRNPVEWSGAIRRTRPSTSLRVSPSTCKHLEKFNNFCVMNSANLLGDSTVQEPFIFV